MNKNLKVSILLFILLSVALPVSGSENIITASKVKVIGEVNDNYANLTYTFTFDNLDADEDVRGKQRFEIPEGMYLSNVSVVVEDNTYFGNVKEVSEAEEDFDEAIEANKSAVLVNQLPTGQYEVDINVKADTMIDMHIYVEGFKIRKLGNYYFDILNLPDGPRLDFAMDIDLKSTFTTVSSLSLSGIGAATITAIENGGYNIEFSENNYLLDEVVGIVYNTEQSSKGDALVTHFNGKDNFFLYQMAPQIANVEDQVPKEYIFVIDTSGSMNTADRLKEAKEAFSTIINNLHIEDYFNVLEFNVDTDLLWSEGTRKANSSNIEDAINWVNNLEGGGGTNLELSLKDGFSSFSEGFNGVSALTLLSDGEPTDGIEDTQTIRENALNYNNYGTKLFTISLGDSTAEDLMEGLAFDTNAKYLQVADSSKASDELLNFYEEFSTPVVSSVSIEYSDVSDLSPSLDVIDDPIFNGSEVIQVGKFSGQLTIETTFRYATFNETSSHTVIETTSENAYIEKLWVIKTIEDLIEQDRNIKDNTLYDDIVNLAVEYGLVIEGYTALVVVVDDDTTTQITKNTGDYSLTHNPPPIEEVYNTTEDAVEVKSMLIFVMVVNISGLLLIHRRRVKNDRSN